MPKFYVAPLTLGQKPVKDFKLEDFAYETEEAAHAAADVLKAEQGGEFLVLVEKAPAP